jgi:membrane-bound lytic murein transglycosylase B
VSSAVPPTGILNETYSTVPAEPAIVTAPEGDASLQATITQAQQSGQSLDEPNVLGGLSGDTLTGASMLDNTASAAAPRLPDGPLGIPGVMLSAYQHVERTMAQTHPGCHLSWTTLGGIGKIESGHASGGRVDAVGNTIGSILGPQLNGSPGMAAIADTDQGMLDADPGWDRAVGPMQFIPASWRSYGAGNPNNIYDSALAAGRYLCAGGTDLSDPAQQAVALFRYNHSVTYVSNVLLWEAGYRTGVFPTPSEQRPVPQTTDTLVLLAADTSPAPVVANLDQPTVTNLDQPAVTDLDAN